MSDGGRDFRRRIRSYAVAVIAVACAVAFKQLLAPFLDGESPFLLFFASVMAAAWFGGAGAGIAAALLAALASDYFFIAPVHQLGPKDAGQALRLAIFLVEAVVVSLFGGALRRAARRARLAERAAKRATAEVAERLEELEAFVGVVPVGLAVARDGGVRANVAAMRILRGPEAAESAAGLAELPQYRALSNGAEIAPEELPLQRSASRGVAVAEVLDVVRDDGARVPLLVSAAPLPRAHGAVAAFIDLTLLRRVEQVARESEQRFRVMADSAPVLIWMSDAEKRCIYLNKPWLAFTGRTLEGDADFGWIDDIHPDDRNRCLAEYRSAFDARSDFQVEYRLRRADGQYRWMLEMASPRTPGGMFAGFIGSCIDITERKEAEQEREVLLERETAAHANAERANRLKEEFLATISHEMRTPLNAILGWARLLARPDVGVPEKMHAAEVIARNAVLQARIVDDILDASRMVAGKLRLDVRVIRDLRSVVAAAIDGVRPAARAKGVEIEATLDPYAGPVLGDADRIQQIVWNLCSNAVKFTGRGGAVRIALAPADTHVEIRVGDTGEGIAPEFLPFVFDRFRQADASSTRRHGGLGLGLAIARHLTELHGGTIVAESAGAACGATFTVRLPVQPDDRLAADAPPAQSFGRSTGWSRLDGRIVLAVDDDIDALDTIRAVLESGGASVLTASSAEEALAVVEIRVPHLLISDIGMPGRDGYWLIRKVRELGGDPARIPAIALTAYARLEDRNRALSEGFQAHVGKPVEPAELLSIAATVSNGNAAQAN